MISGILRNLVRVPVYFHTGIVRKLTSSGGLVVFEGNQGAVTKSFERMRTRTTAEELEKVPPEPKTAEAFRRTW